MWEFNDSVETVQEFWTEVRFQRSILGLSASFCRYFKDHKASVWSGDNHSVLEVDRVPWPSVKRPHPRLEGEGWSLEDLPFHFVKKDDWGAGAFTPCQLGYYSIIKTKLQPAVVSTSRNGCGRCILTCPNGWWHLGSEHIKFLNCLANSASSTPVGPTKRKLPIGRFPSVNSARFRQIVTALLLQRLYLTDNFVCNGDPYLSNVRYQLHPFETLEYPSSVLQIQPHRWLLLLFMVFRMISNFFKFFDSNFCFQSCFCNPFSRSFFLFGFFFFTCSTAWISVTGCWAAKWAAVTSIQVNGLYQASYVVEGPGSIINHAKPKLHWRTTLWCFS